MYAVSAFETAGNRGSSIGMLVFGLRTLSTPACQSSLQSNCKHFGGAQTICRQQQDDRIITLAWSFRSRDRVQNLLHVFPRQSAWGPLVCPVSGCDHSTRQISRQSSCHLHKSQECPERAAGIRDGSFANARGKLSYKRINVCQGCPCNELCFALQAPEEATGGLDITHQRPLRERTIQNP